MTTTRLHHGQESFGGLKAFHGKDGKIRVFRMDEDAKRIQSSSRDIKMTELSIEMFEGAVRKVVELNEHLVPPYEGGAALYIRPLMISLGARVGVKPTPGYVFIIFVTPVGPYFKGGFRPSKAYVLREYDRAAPSKTSVIKVNGNCAVSLVAGEIAHPEGYAAVLYLDPKEKKYLDEYGSANFFGIHGNSYIAPQSHSILPSITNRSLQQLAEDMDLAVERRPVPFEKVTTFGGVVECGTAAVITSISQIDDLDKDKSFVITRGGKPDPVCEKLYHKLHAIQYDDKPDTYGWISTIE